MERYSIGEQDGFNCSSFRAFASAERSTFKT